MFAIERLRFRLLLAHIGHSLLEETTIMALDARGYPGVAGGGSRPGSSTASSPSLRARRSELVRESVGPRSSTPDGAGGNVKVVVRVRAFLPRGMQGRRVIV